MIKYFLKKLNYFANVNTKSYNVELTVIQMIDIFVLLTLSIVLGMTLNCSGV